MLEQIFDNQKKAFQLNPMPTAGERSGNLQRLKETLLENQKLLINAVNKDFTCRAADETRLAEILPSVEGLRDAARKVSKWMKPSKRHVGVLFQPATAKVAYQPLGVVGIITPWNYPILLALGPLTGALAAGNRAVIRMSRNTPETAVALKYLIKTCFDENQVAVLTGDEASGSEFTSLHWDHLVFTGSTSVGRHVMRAASENLTPVTLELGGKSPAIIGSDVPMQDAAERIAFGKTVNSGQTCVAPDYVLCPESRVEEFIKIFRECVIKMFPTILNNPQYTAIISRKEKSRLIDMIENARERGADIIEINPADENFSGGQKLPLFILLNTTNEMEVANREIFGPLLPVIPYKKLENAVAYVNERPRPLALYYFDYDKQRTAYLLDHTHSGGGVINDTLIHVAQDDLPFGGIGESGMGRYHGREGFLTLSNPRGVVIKPRLNIARYVYPPYGRLIHRTIYGLFLKRWFKKDRSRD